ncbi:MAG TPA: septum formation initiator family protein [Opitutaceae bacterium]|nr:septum formation initiator family protein [Opitutaceae bacterium]
MKLHRAITFAYVFVLTGLGLVAGALILETREELGRLRRTETDLRKKVADAEERLKAQNRILERLRTDPYYVEKVIQRQSNFGRPGDVIFKFED